MNINRLLTRREKDGSGGHRRDKSRDKSSDKKTRPLSSDGIFAMFKADPQKKLDKDQSNKINSIRQRLTQRGYSSIDDDQITYALSSKHADGDTDKAFELVVLFQESVEGIIKPYDPTIQMLGAENRSGVTCYLDSLLFSMFARLGSFEPILCTSFEDEPRRRLSTLIRLWVNMLRTGRLIQTDVTGFLQDALAACGWEDAALLEQQDTSEAFSFITETLKLPLLTLKMDIFHTGKEDAKDDHKFIQERLLEVAVPDDPPEGSDRAIRLEDCLESYFNNRVEVVRHLERTNTLSSIRSGEASGTPVEKEVAQHVEIAELAWSTPNTPIVGTPHTPLTPDGGRNRATSIIRHRLIQEDGKVDVTNGSDAASPHPLTRKGSIRKEVLMPAWQFFNLIPWYTKTSPTNDAEVAAHFTQTRPVLGICLKRYGMTDGGRAYRKNTFIDIPLDIRLPHFIQDDMILEDGPLMGNFKLSLQSIICHRGNSVNAGHYVSFIRGTTEIADGDFESARRLSNANQPPHYSADRWIKFDDLSEPRVQYVDIEQALKDEMPYLLFYQVQPACDVSPPGSESEPPSYSDSAISMKLSSPQPESRSPQFHRHGYFDGAGDEPMPTIRLSSEFERTETPRRSINLPDDERRGSLAFTEGSMASTASIVLSSPGPVTPGEETTAQRMSRAAARFTKVGNKSRPTSQAGEGRISATISRLSLMRSRDQLKSLDTSKDSTLATDGGFESRKNSISIEEPVLRPEEGTIGRSKSKKGKKRDKSKGPSEMGDGDHHHHIHKNRGKGKDLPDRECTVM